MGHETGSSDAMLVSMPGFCPHPLRPQPLVAANQSVGGVIAGYVTAGADA